MLLVVKKTKHHIVFLSVRIERQQAWSRSISRQERTTNVIYVFSSSQQRNLKKHFFPRFLTWRQRTVHKHGYITSYIISGLKIFLLINSFFQKKCLVETARKPHPMI